MEEDAEFSVQVFKGDIEDPLIQARTMTKEMARLFPEFKKRQKIQARMMKVRYDSLINVGFTDEQALWICKDE